MNTIDALGDIRFEPPMQHFLILKAETIEAAALHAAAVIASGNAGSRQDALEAAKSHAPCVVAFEAKEGSRTYDDFVSVPK